MQASEVGRRAAIWSTVLVDWNLRACARRGHATYAPTEPELAARLTVDTPVGPAWRCLRCGDFALGEPHGRGPADDAPIVLRGRALRDATILRLVAVERFFKGLFVLIAAFGVLKFKTSKDAIARSFDEYIPLLKPLTSKIGYQIEDSAVVERIRHLLETGTTTLTWIAVGLAVYGALQLTEGVGLWLLKRWGEYFAVVATAMFIPLEVYELIEKVTVTRVALLVLNVGIVVWLLLAKRLFGLRGGRAAHEAERHTVSLIEVETAAAHADLSHPAKVDLGLPVGRTGP